MRFPQVAFLSVLCAYKHLYLKEFTKRPESLLTLTEPVAANFIAFYTEGRTVSDTFPIPGNVPVQISGQPTTQDLLEKDYALTNLEVGVDLSAADTVVYDGGHALCVIGKFMYGPCDTPQSVT